jgi:hypothetical protein
MSQSTDAAQVIREALPTDPNGGKTAREISEATGVKYSTVTEHLRNLEGAGEARKEKSGRQVTWTLVTGDTATGRAASETGATVVAEEAGPSGPVPVRADPNPAETPVEASESLTVAGPTGDPGTAAHGDVVAPDGPTAAQTHTVPAIPLEQASSVGDVAAFMEQQRPIPDAPVKPERATRTRSAGPAREVRNDFGSGGLQAAVLRYMDEHRNEDGSYQEFGPYELSLALSAHASSVAYSLKQTTGKGQTVRTTGEDEKPRFRLATADEAKAASAKKDG